jgi:hypothetical protein
VAQFRKPQDHRSKSGRVALSRFKTVGIEAGIEHRILDVIQGHRPRNVAEGYGEITIKTQATAIAKLPRYKVQL